MVRILADNYDLNAIKRTVLESVEEVWHQRDRLLHINDLESVHNIGLCKFEYLLPGGMNFFEGILINRLGVHFVFGMAVGNKTQYKFCKQNIHTKMAMYSMLQMLIIALLLFAVIITVVGIQLKNYCGYTGSEAYYRAVLLITTTSHPPIEDVTDEARRGEFMRLMGTMTLLSVALFLGVVGFFVYEYSARRRAVRASPRKRSPSRR